MFCVATVLIFAIRVTDAQHLKHDIISYFDSESVYYFRREWEHYRKAMEQAIANALQETIGSSALNVLRMEKSEIKLAKAFYHTHGRVQIIMYNLELNEFPHSWLPEVSFSLSANVLKLETRLTKMVINADYTLMRNKTDKIIAAQEQDAFRNSPFLFQSVQSMGRLTLTLEGCILSGYVIARLSAVSVNLGHHKFSLTKCDYNVEIYQPGAGVPPVMARFSAKMPGNGFGIKHLVLKPLEEEFLSKIQSAIFSFINTTAIFGPNLPALEEDQTIIFRKTESNLTHIIRDINKKTANVNGGAFDIEDYFVSWDDFTPYNVDEFVPPGSRGMGGIRMANMVLTGLDTAYISNSGGPYMVDRIMVGEQIRFSSIQVRGDVYYTKLNQDQFKFAVSISDLAVNIDAYIDLERPLEVEMVGFRKLEFSEPRVVFNPAEGIITGYLLNKIPKFIQKIIKIDLTKDVMPKRNPSFLTEHESAEHVQQATKLLIFDSSVEGPPIKRLSNKSKIVQSRSKTRKQKFGRNRHQNMSSNVIL